MPGFLQEVAADLYDRYGDDISSLSVLFPSRRARLFFIDALSGIAERPLWQPRWTTIDELMSEISGLRIGDRVRLVQTPGQSGEVAGVPVTIRNAPELLSIIPA